MTTSDDACTASGRVRDALRTQILRGGLPPGTRLMDRALALQHGVSRNSVREALRLLESDGLVVSALNAGSSVRVLTPSDVADIYAARRVLEIGGVRASSRAPDRMLTEVDEAATAGLQERNLEDWRGAGTASLVFHSTLVALAGSARLDQFFTDLAAQLRLAFAVMPDEAAFQSQWLDRDRTIADLLLSGRRDAAEVELLAYLAASEAAVIDAVRAAQRSVLTP
ncbi:GntR family transcriptional regulator [Kocuria aegyptia]|uniref:GntR family transcriptional regulator n=1 Tax=Kocuria aegyptia TaxID=330943 RepID=A0ABN2KRS1_9MICC